MANRPTWFSGGRLVCHVAMAAVAVSAATVEVERWLQLEASPFDTQPVDQLMSHGITLVTVIMRNVVATDATDAWLGTFPSDTDCGERGAPALTWLAYRPAVNLTIPCIGRPAKVCVLVGERWAGDRRLVAASEPFETCSPTLPVRPRLSLTASGDLTVTFTTFAPITDPPRVDLLQADPNNMGMGQPTWQQSPPGTTVRIARDDLCSAPANSEGWMDLGYTHTVVIPRSMAGPQRLLAYRPAYGTTVGPMVAAMLPPIPGDVSQPTSLAIFADLGTSSPSPAGSLAVQSDPTARPPPLDDAAHLWRAYGEEAAYTVSHVTSGAAQMLMVEVLAQMARAFNASSGGDGAKPEGLSPADGSLPDMSKVGLGPHAIANFGDTSYCTGYLGCWLSYLEQWQYATMTVPYLPGPGNHEWDAPGTATVWNGTDSGGECGVPASVLFPAPGYIARGGLQSPDGRPVRAAVDAPWYSFEVGLGHVIMASTEHAFARGSEQYTWLERDLASVNRSRTPWVIVTLHRPMYVDSTSTPDLMPASDQGVAALLQAELEDLFMVHRVNLVFGGHHHSMQRLSAIYHDQPVQRSSPVQSEPFPLSLFRDPRAPVYSISGVSGAPVYFNNDAAHPPPWAEWISYARGYTKVTLFTRHLVWQAIDSVNGTVLDAFIIEQPDPHAAAWPIAPRPSPSPSPSLWPSRSPLPMPSPSMASPFPSPPEVPSPSPLPSPPATELPLPAETPSPTASQAAGNETAFDVPVDPADPVGRAVPLGIIIALPLMAGLGLAYAIFRVVELRRDRLQRRYDNLEVGGVEMAPATSIAVTVAADAQGGGGGAAHTQPRAPGRRDDGL